VTNLAQADLWNGPTGDHWARHVERYERLLGRLTPHLLRGAALGPTDRVLDVGCGCGNTTRKAAAIAASAHGVDLSGPMLAHARKTVTTATFEQADAQSHDFGEYDVVISQLGVMFFEDQAAAFANLRKTAPRLAFMSWQHPSKNEHGAVKRAALAPHVPMPPPTMDSPGTFSLSDPDRVRDVLTAAGYSTIELTDVQEHLVLGTTAADTTEFVLGDPLVQELFLEAGEAAADRAREALLAAYTRYETPEGVRLGSAAWLVTAT
jgi:SAM-dependent methyltransferase